MSQLSDLLNTQQSLILLLSVMSQSLNSFYVGYVRRRTSGVKYNIFTQVSVSA